MGGEQVIKESKFNGGEQVIKASKFNGGEQVTEESKFCYGEEQKGRFNRLLKYYVGGHNFHNFTTRTKVYIVSFDAKTTVTVEGIEFIKCEVIGQSFMLHQIRKMIGLAVAIMRNCAPESLISTALRKDANINVPTAPEVGLYLERKEGAVGLWLHSLNHRNYPDLRIGIQGDANVEKSGQVEKNIANQGDANGEKSGQVKWRRTWLAQETPMARKVVKWRKTWLLRARKVLKEENISFLRECRTL